MRYKYKKNGNKKSMFKMLYFQEKLNSINEQNQDTNFKIKEICK